MSGERTAYELSRSQVETPPRIVELFWRFTNSYRDGFQEILDLGAGDGRFAIGGNYDRYVGVEIDSTKRVRQDLPTRASLSYGCAFDLELGDYSACVGNPPYVRGHHLEAAWRDRIAAQLEASTATTLHRKCNLYVYFFLLALLRANKGGLVSLVVPFEWTSRPAARPLRDFIRRHGWSVDVYRFDNSVFPGVLTTASVSVVDKAASHGTWRYFEIGDDGDTSVSRLWPDSPRVLRYENRGAIYAERGLSPGSQKVFTLTNGERIHAGLTMEDVVPCVTSLRALPSHLERLTETAFRKRFVEAGARCWLVRSYEQPISPRLKRYLESIPKSRRDTATCRARNPWYSFRRPAAPLLLVSSGFKNSVPKVLCNSVGAVAVGGVTGVHSTVRVSVSRLREYLLAERLDHRVVPHANGFTKLEIGQLNSLLNSYPA